MIKRPAPLALVCLTLLLAVWSLSRPGTAPRGRVGAWRDAGATVATAAGAVAWAVSTTHPVAGITGVTATVVPAPVRAPRASGHPPAPKARRAWRSASRRGARDLPLGLAVAGGHQVRLVALMWQPSSGAARSQPAVVRFVGGGVRGPRPPPRLS